MKKFLVLSLTLVMMFVSSACVFAAERTDRVMAYIGAWKDWTVNDIQGDKLTHLYIAFARVGNDFSLSNSEARLHVEDKPDMPLPDVMSQTMISDAKWEEIGKIKKKYPKLKIIIAVGGWFADGFSDMAATKVGREVFADSVAAYIKKYNLDGVDIDWEYPVNGGWVIKARPEDKANFTELIKTLRAKIGKDKELSFCAAASATWLEWVDIKAVVSYVDTVNLMAYDMHGVWDELTDHHTNLNPNKTAANGGSAAAASVDRLLKAGVPANKLVLGMATYGREYRGVESKNNGLFQPFNKKDATSWRGGIIPFNIIDKYYVNKNGFKRYWDSQAMAPYLYSADEKTFVSYEDQESIAAKVKYVKSNKLGGVMYWEYTLDPTGVLLNTMYENMKK